MAEPRLLRAHLLLGRLVLRRRRLVLLLLRRLLLLPSRREFGHLLL